MHTGHPRERRRKNHVGFLRTNPTRAQSLHKKERERDDRVEGSEKRNPKRSDAKTEQRKKQMGKDQKMRLKSLWN